MANEAKKVYKAVIPYLKGPIYDLGGDTNFYFPNVENIKVNLNPKCTDDIVDDCSLLKKIEDNVAGTVFSSHCLEDIVDTELALYNWLRILKPEGYLILYLPHKKYYPNIGMPHGNHQHKHDFIPIDIVNCLNKLYIKIPNNIMQSEVRTDVKDHADYYKNMDKLETIEYSFLVIAKKL